MRRRCGSRQAATASERSCSGLEFGARADRVVEDGDVEDAASDPAQDGAPVPVVLKRGEGHPATLGLQPEQPAEGRRDPDRAAAVRTERDRHHARGHGRGAAAGGAAG